MKKKIWIVSYYTMPPEYDTHLRHGKFAHYLGKEGFEVTIISSSLVHGKNIDLIKDHSVYVEKQFNGHKHVLIKSLYYGENSLLRMLSLFLFSFRLLRIKSKFEKPDIIIHNAHAPFDALVYRCARKLKAKYIVEVWDLWPESFVAFGLINKNNPFMKIAYMIEKMLYKKADKMIFTMEGSKDYIRSKGWDKEHGGSIDLDKVNYINNGIDIQDFKKNKTLYKISDSDLEDPAMFNVVYLGSIRLANDLKQLIDAAELLKNYKNIKFLIYGDGSERSYLKKYCLQKQISNVLFKEKWINIKYVPYVLSCSSLNILNFKFNDILQYGGSQGKLFQYLAAGKPIISNSKMGYDLIERYNLGLSLGTNSSEEYADAILSIKNMNSTDYEAMHLRVLETAKEFDYKVLSAKMTLILRSL